jgi:hypothetical protein
MAVGVIQFTMDRLKDTDGLIGTTGQVLTSYERQGVKWTTPSSSGGTIGGATVENQVSFGSATASAITSVSTFTHTEDSLVETLSLGGTAIATRVQTIFKATHRNASNARARYSLYNGTSLKGYFQSSGTAGEIVLGSSTGDLVLQVESTHNITMASTSGTNVGIGLTDPKSKLDVAGGIKMSSVPDGDNTSRALIPGTFRYRTEIDGVGGTFAYSYVDMCMQTDNTVFTWTNIKTVRWTQ